MAALVTNQCFIEAGVEDEAGNEIINRFHLEAARLSDQTVRTRSGPKHETWSRVLSPLGSGGFGTAWLERDQNGDLRVVKDVKKDLRRKNPYWIEELRAMAILSKHWDHFPAFYGWYHTDAYVFMAMEHFNLGDLRGCVKGALPDHDSRLITGQLAKALHYMHCQSIVHRDLKPHNIFVRAGAPSWHVVVADFGISRRVRTSYTEMNTSFVGSFTAPEMQDFDIDGCESSERYTKAVDLWSLGCISYWLLTATVPVSTGKMADYCRSPSSSKVPWHNMCDNARNFIFALLSPVPKDRATAQEACSHTWLCPGTGIDSRAVTHSNIAINPDQTSFEPEHAWKEFTVNTGSEPKKDSVQEGEDSTAIQEQMTVEEGGMKRSWTDQFGKLDLTQEITSAAQEVPDATEISSSRIPRKLVPNKSPLYPPPLRPLRGRLTVSAPSTPYTKTVATWSSPIYGQDPFADIFDEIVLPPTIDEDEEEDSRSTIPKSQSVYHLARQCSIGLPLDDATSWVSRPLVSTTVPTNYRKKIKSERGTHELDLETSQQQSQHGRVDHLFFKQFWKSEPGGEFIRHPKHTLKAFEIIVPPDLLPSAAPPPRNDVQAFSARAIELPTNQVGREYGRKSLPAISTSTLPGATDHRRTFSRPETSNEISDNTSRVLPRYRQRRVRTSTAPATKISDLKDLSSETHRHTPWARSSSSNTGPDQSPRTAVKQVKGFLKNAWHEMHS